MKIIINKITVLINFKILLLVFSLSSCVGNNLQSPQQDKQRAKKDAKNASSETHFAYLQCYALNPKEKQNCLTGLKNKYISPELRRNTNYTTSFQYEAEKLGFMQFLKNKNFPCNNIKNGPQYSKETESYVVKCSENKLYLLRFDYEEGEWIVG